MKLAAVLVVTAASLVALVKHAHHDRPVPLAVAPAVAPAAALTRASRGETRSPLRVAPGPLAGRAPVRRATRNGAHLADVTMYCGTGHSNAAGRWPRIGDVATLSRAIPFGTRVRIAGRVLTVMDRIGAGSDFDVYGGSDAGCQARALAFGRRHLSVVVES